MAIGIVPFPFGSYYIGRTHRIPRTLWVSTRFLHASVDAPTYSRLSLEELLRFFEEQHAHDAQGSLAWSSSSFRR